MNNPTPPSSSSEPSPSLVDLVADESLTALRRAYHASEIFHLSDEHQAMKLKLQGPVPTSSSAPQEPKLGTSDAGGDRERVND